MFGRMMNRYYYGKSGKGDFRPEDLPKNRMQLFWEMLRIRLSALCRLNLMSAIVFVPLLLLLMVSLTSYLQGVNQYLNMRELADPLYAAVEAGAEPDAAELEALLAENEYTADDVEWYRNFHLDTFTQSLLWQLALLSFPCILITGPVETGLAYVTRNWARDEHAFVWSDFKDAIKENWKQGLGVSLITGVVPPILYVCWTFYGNMASQRGFIFMIPQIAVLIISIVWMLGLIYMYPLIVTYKLKFSQVIRNGLMLGIGRLPHNVGIRLLALVPSLLLFVTLLFTTWGMYVILLWIVYYVVFGIALNRFIIASLSNAVFDRYINSRISGAVVNRGLSTESDDDDGDEEEEN